ncbi:MAG: Alpha/beta hydrolase family protein [Syntrophorhabdus sp. PtaB.Bin184]|jgi:alpha/beta superfamily hydrolase|nr:MAG: Alpha/beta hydrolase family protein [Syntrophorhabdus sp. PtaB.Bin184]
MAMSIERVTIESDQNIEGLLRRQSRKAGVVVCHPHPLYGGNMYNNVVSAIEDGYAAQGFTTLIFNFRGVGDSKGEYDEGDGEVRDATAAYGVLKEHLDNDAHITLAGYSFGAWVISRSALEIDRFDSLFLVSFPCLIYKYEHLKGFNREIIIVGGTYDDIAPMDDLYDLYKNLTTLDKHLKVIDTTHFYAGKETELIDFIKETVPKR